MTRDEKDYLMFEQNENLRKALSEIARETEWGSGLSAEGMRRVARVALADNPPLEPDA